MVRCLHEAKSQGEQENSPASKKEETTGPRVENRRAETQEVGSWWCCGQVTVGKQANWQLCSTQTPATLKGELKKKNQQQFAGQRTKPSCSHPERQTFCSHTRKLSGTEIQVRDTAYSLTFISPKHS